MTTKQGGIEMIWDTAKPRPDLPEYTEGWVNKSWAEKELFKTRVARASPHTGVGGGQDREDISLFAKRQNALREWILSADTPIERALRSGTGTAQSRLILYANRVLIWLKDKEGITVAPNEMSLIRDAIKELGYELPQRKQS